MYSHLHLMNAHVTDQQYAPFPKVSSNMLQNSIRYNKTDYIGTVGPKLLATANFQTIAHYAYDFESFFLTAMILKDVCNSCSNICLQEEEAAVHVYDRSFLQADDIFIRKVCAAARLKIQKRYLVVYACMT